MTDFKLPRIKGRIESPKPLTMDEYLEFVNFHLENTFDREAYEKWKKLSVIDVPFSFKT